MPPQHHHHHHHTDQKRVTFLEPAAAAAEQHQPPKEATTNDVTIIMSPKDPERGGIIPDKTKDIVTTTGGGGGGGGNYYNSSSRSNMNMINPTSSYFDDDLEDDSSRWVSWLVPAIVVVNIAVFIAVMFVNNCPKHDGGGGGGGRGRRCMVKFLGRFSFQPLNENPLFGPSSATLTKMGALEWSTRMAHNHVLWRLLTSIWLHAGLLHLLANMLSLVFVGIRLEQQFGFVRVGAIYLVSGIGGGILSSLFMKKSVVSVGASGALFGLLGAMLAELVTNWTIYSNKVAAMLTLVFVIAINLAVGILPHVDNFAHIGGFVTGLLLGFVLLLRPHIGWLTRRNLRTGHHRVRSKYRVYQIALRLVSLLLLIIWFTVGSVMLVLGENGYEHCHWCRYLSCVPTSKWKCNA